MDEEIEPIAEPAPLTEVVAAETDVEKKIALWRAGYEGEATELLKEQLAEADGTHSREDYVDAYRNHQLAYVEVENEIAVLRAERAAEGKDVTAEDIDALAERKALEMQIEREYGIPLTSEAFDARRVTAGLAHEKWDIEELEGLAKELDRMPPEHRNAIRSMSQEGEQKWQKWQEKNAAGEMEDKEGFRGRGGDAALCHPDGNIELFSAGPVGYVHEMAHAVDFADQRKGNGGPVAEYKERVDWENHQEADVDPELARRLKEAAVEGGFGQRSEVVGDRVYQVFITEEVNEKGETEKKYSYSSYSATSIPLTEDQAGVAQAEGSFEKWRDGYEYGRSHDAGHFFTEQYIMATRDPVRMYSDLIDRPRRREEELEQLIEDNRRDGLDTSGLEIELRQAGEERIARMDQYDTVRDEVFGVSRTLVDDAAGALPPEQQRAFRDQAKHCITPGQVDKLRQQYERGEQVDATKIRDAAGELDSTLPPEQVAAFREDAENCFTPEQLARLKDAYARGLRKDRKWDSAELDRADRDYRRANPGAAESYQGDSLGD